MNKLCIHLYAILKLILKINNIALKNYIYTTKRIKLEYKLYFHREIPLLGTTSKKAVLDIDCKLKEVGIALISMQLHKVIILIECCEFLLMKLRAVKTRIRQTG